MMPGQEQFNKVVHHLSATPTQGACQRKKRVFEGALAYGHHVGRIGKRARATPNPEP
jgi:hypothetical protein